MPTNIIAFGASNSANSINKILANYAASQVPNAIVNLIDLNDFEMPIYSIDRENNDGIPQKANYFLKLIKEADGIVISMAEHNGAYTVAFKNIFDWASRTEKNVWQNKPMLLLSTSPGTGAAKFVFETAFKKFTHMTSSVVTGFSLPSFHDNFSIDKGITDEKYSVLMAQHLQIFVEAM